MEERATASGNPIRQMTDAELARPRSTARWPVELKRLLASHNRRRGADDLAFLLKLGLAVSLATSLVDYLAVPERAAQALVFRLATIAPLTFLGLFLLHRGRVRGGKIVVTVTMSLFAASGIWLSSFATSDVIARYSMGVVILLFVGLHSLPFAIAGKVRFALFFCLVTFAAGIFPNPLPPSLLLQHVLLSAMSAGAGLMLAERIWRYEAREFLRSLQLQFDRDELERSNMLLRELSESDALTGLANRRSFERVFDDARRTSHGCTIALMMIDLDHFKRFNDRHGHQAGDRCLVEVARELELCLAKHDGHVARFGGEEFIAFVVESETCDGAQVAEHLRSALASLSIPTGTEQVSRITTSIGLARATHDHAMGPLIARADGALYRAKQRGRNRIEIADPAAAEFH